MKKFTFMLLAAFVAVVSWAVLPSDLIEKRASLQLSGLNKDQAKQMTPKQKLADAKLQVPASRLAKAMGMTNARKAPKKASIADLLTAEWMLCTDYYEYDEEAGQLVPATITGGGTPIKFSMVDAGTVAIEGFTSDATEPVQATFSTTVSEDLQTAGVIAVVTIEDGQTLLESDYGPIVLKNLSAEEDGTPLTAYVLQTGMVVINDIWAGIIGGDGEYAGYLWTDYGQSIAVPVNGKMAWGDGDAATEVPVVIMQDQENPKVATVFNFGGQETAIEVTMKENKSFVISEQPVFYYNSEYGYFYVSGLNIVNGSYYLATLMGQGTENTLTFNVSWMLYSPTKGSIYETYDPATITMTQGEFLYPVIPDVAATPANPEVKAVGNYDAEQGYGSIAFTIPTVDVDGNDLKEDKLFYQFYSDIAGDIQPITFTTDLYEKLTENMSIIPYTFTDNYDFADKGDYKVVFMNYNFNAMYDRIGVKSIYTGGDETNESEIVWADVEKEEPAGPTVESFDFNSYPEDWPCSTSATHKGDITEDYDITAGNVTLTVSPSTTNTPNRWWMSNDVVQLRVYSGTLTFAVAEGEDPITKITFNAGKWNDGNSADSGEFDGSVWTGSAQKVVVTIAGNTQLNSIEVQLGEEGVEPVAEELVTLPAGVEPVEYTLVASGATSQGDINIQDTKLVAFDGNDVYVQGLAYYFPDAFIKGTLTEAGQVVFPSGQFVGEDEYGKEYIIGVTVADDNSFVYAPSILFDFDPESGVLSMAEGVYYGESGDSNKVSLYNYFESAVYTPGAFVMPDLVELPEGVATEVWTIDGKFNDSMSSENIVRQTEVAFDGTDIYVKGIPFYFEDAWMKGTINAETGIATFATGQFVGSDDYGMEFMVGSEDGETLCDIEFTYDAEAKLLTQLTPYIYENGGSADEITPYGYWSDMIIYAGEAVVEEPVTAPEGLETETYLFTAKMIENEASRKAEGDLEATEVTFDFNASEVATSSSESTDGDILETLELTEGSVTLTVSPKDEDVKTENRFWSTNNGPQLRVYSGTLTFEVPEGSSMTQIAFNAGKWNADNKADPGAFDGATWTGDAQKVIVTIAGNTQINNIVVSVKSEGEGSEPGTETGVDYAYQMQVGFDGNDVYFKGLSDNTADMWLKGTLSEDGKTVTIPANQYMGTRSVMWFNFAYYFTAVDAEGAMQDIVLNYDAEANKFTTDQTLVLHDGKRSLGLPYQTFYDVVITKMLEFAATPADPSIEEFKGTGSYPSVKLNVPAKDVDGNDLIGAKLFYTLWVDIDGEEQPLVLTTADYRNLTEDMTEIPYTLDDQYDIYAGGSRVYLNMPVDTSWKKIGVQSIYYGGGVTNKSNIVWMDLEEYWISTGISQVNAESGKAPVVVFDLQGRRVAQPGKGLYIVNGKKVVLK